MHEGLSDEQLNRLCGVQDFWGNNCFGWLVGTEKVQSALLEVLFRLPEEVADVFLFNSNIVVIDGSLSAAWSWQQPCPPHDEWREKCLSIIVLPCSLLELPYKAIVGVVAHEFAHVFLGYRSFTAEPSKEIAEQEATATARQWGFREEIDCMESEQRT